MIFKKLRDFEQYRGFTQEVKRGWRTYLCFLSSLIFTLQFDSMASEGAIVFILIATLIGEAWSSFANARDSNTMGE